jgi:hypothetical protein
LFIAGFLLFGDNLTTLTLLTVVASLLAVCGRLVIATYLWPGRRHPGIK